ncbi:MAG TPA: hypothetical protein PLI95_20225 [Polyangiaceae bacterium]|nr:hypothetical protein [Polyangiaceae bacterium]
MPSYFEHVPRELARRLLGFGHPRQSGVCRDEVRHHAFMAEAEPVIPRGVAIENERAGLAKHRVVHRRGLAACPFSECVGRLNAPQNRARVESS